MWEKIRFCECKRQVQSLFPGARARLNSSLLSACYCLVCLSVVSVWLTGWFPPAISPSLCLSALVTGLYCLQLSNKHLPLSSGFLASGWKAIAQCPVSTQNVHCSPTTPTQLKNTPAHDQAAHGKWHQVRGKVTKAGSRSQLFLSSPPGCQWEFLPFISVSSEFTVINSMQLSI